jgi:hypothetical protein
MNADQPLTQMQKKKVKMLPKRKKQAAKKAAAPAIQTLDKAELNGLWLDLGEEVPPPVTTRAQTLPLEELSWENFERLCYRLAILSGDCIDARIYGIPGQLQMGIDVMMRTAAKYVTWQCKRYQKFRSSDLVSAVDEFLAHDWAKQTKTFQIAVTADLSDTNLVKTVEKQARRCSAKGIDLVPLDKSRLSVLLKNHPDLVDDFFGREWVVAFCGQEAGDSLRGRKLSKAKRILARTSLAEIYATHFNAVDLGLPAAAASLQEAISPFSLQQRYVIPKVDAITSQLVEKTGPEIGSTEAGTQVAAISGSTTEKLQHLGFRVNTLRDKRGLFEWLGGIELGLVLGGPGSGKSAALRFLALDLLSDHPKSESTVKKWGRSLPVFVPFAMLTQFVEKKEVSGIGEFLKKWLEQLGATKDVVALLLEALDDNRLLLVIDGLDEWVNEEAANSAFVMIVDFINSRKLPAVASARPLGYERLGTGRADWKKAELRPFELQEQRQFVTGWFSHFKQATSPGGATGSNTLAWIKNQTEDFLSKISADEDLGELAGIPLLLSALVYLRLLGRILPHSRFEALEQITKALIQEQPRRRAAAALQGGSGQFQQQPMLERGLEFLAFFIHGKPGSESTNATDARNALSEFYQSDEFLKPADVAMAAAAEQIRTSPKDIGILIERQPGQVGFLYRSLQEFLAAKEISHWAFAKTKEFILARCNEPSWQEIILGSLYLLQRRNEVDDILTAIKDLKLGPLEEPMQKILLARAVFGEIRCSPLVARQSAEIIFQSIEKSSWMSLRKALVVEATKGVNSEVAGALVRERISRWFPGREQWRMRLFSSLANKPEKETGEGLFTALYNSQGAAEMKEIVEALASGAASWPKFGDTLCGVLFGAAEEDLLCTALHGLCLGWPNHAQLHRIVLTASQSRSEKLRCLALIYRAERGDRTPEVRNGIKEFCKRETHIYPWEDLLISTLASRWGNDDEFRSLALDAVRNWRIPTAWSEQVGFPYLIRARPMDDEVAMLIAEKMLDTDHGFILLDHRDEWDVIVKNFKGHPAINSAAESWLDRHGLSEHNEVAVARVAALGGTARCKKALFDRLASGPPFPQWIVSVLLELCGKEDPTLQAAFNAFISEKARLSSVANFLPTFIADKMSCKQLLMEVLQKDTTFNVVHALSGLHEIAEAGSADVVERVELRLKDDGRFWRTAKGALITFYPQHPVVKNLAKQELEGADPPLYAMTDVYAEAPDIRPIFDLMLGRLHDELRLVLVQVLSNIGSGEHDFVRDVLIKYRSEWNGAVRTAASFVYYSYIQKTQSNVAPFVAELRKELQAVGSGFDESRQAAAAGLLALQEPKALVDPVLNFHGHKMPIGIRTSSDPNWPLMQALLATWDKTKAELGEQVWGLFRDWDFIVWHLANTNRNGSAITVPQEMLEEAKRRAGRDIDSFRVISVLEGKTPEFREFCLGLFERLRRNAGGGPVTWGLEDKVVWFEAAHFLAKHYGGDPAIGSRLEDTAKASLEPSAPMVALCRGWPSSAFINELWAQRNERPENPEPLIAWLVSTKADEKEFCNYLADIPKRLPEQTWRRFPAETVRAVRHRLRADAAAQSEILVKFRDEEDPDILASIARLTGLENQDRKALLDWARKRLEAVRKADDLQPLGFDMFFGTARPVEFCLLEACFTSE